METDKLEALLKAATPGPWRLVADEEGEPAQCIMGRGWDIATAWGGYNAAEHDAALIAAAPDLAAEVLRLRAENAQLVAANQALVTPTVKVKPLVWHDHMDGKSHDGSAHDDENLYEIDMQDSMYRLCVATVIGGAYISHYRNLDAAKASAQADYEARILSALDMTPATTLKEGDGERIKIAACLLEERINHIETRARAEKAEAEVARLREALTELITCVEDGCFCSEMRMATAMSEARTALTPEGDDHE